ncbi:MAG: RHS repeat-associated core domain-containing protein [Thermoanaerobaculia bacterium]
MSEPDSAFRYDGRGYLREVRAMMPASGGGGAVFPFSDDFESGDICAWSVAVGWEGTECPIGPEETTTYATYDSAGRLHQLAREGGAAPVSIFYFAGRPVASWDPDPDVQFRLLTTDHLGTPIHQMTLGGTTDWLGGFEPYGGDFAGAANAGLFLRLPGQWNDGTWTDAALGTEINYNVHRWYEAGTGRYTQDDPLLIMRERQFYLYAYSNPLRWRDPLGLFVFGGNCDSKNCRSPSLADCGSEPDTMCAIRVINGMRRRAAEPSCRQALIDNGRGDFGDMLVPGDRRAVIGCPPDDPTSPCNSQNSDTGGMAFAFAGTTVIPLCGQAFGPGGWEGAEQKFMHEFLHAQGGGHRPGDADILKACYPAFNPGMP